MTIRTIATVTATARRLGLLAILLACAAMPASAQALSQALNESVFTVPVSVLDLRGHPVSGPMTVTQFKPAGAGPFPLAILLHGRGPDRAAIPRFRYTAAARWLLARGFAVLVPTRLGYGLSDPSIDPEGAGRCGQRRYTPALEAAASSTVQLIDYARQLSFIDARHTLIIGQSYGGATAIALAAKRVDGVVGVINFAGGSGGDPDKRPGAPCDADKLSLTFAHYGESSRVPTLWVYTANDKWMGVDAPQRWFATFKHAGGVGQFLAMPAFGDDGHALFGKGIAIWRPDADRFLDTLGFAQRAPAQPPSAPLSGQDISP